MTTSTLIRRTPGAATRFVRSRVIPHRGIGSSTFLPHHGVDLHLMSSGEGISSHGIRPHLLRCFSSEDESAESQGAADVVEAVPVDRLEIETRRIIDLFTSKSDERSTIEVKTIDSILLEWTERAPHQEWGRKAADISLQLLDALERNAESDPSHCTLTPDTAMYNYVLHAYAQSYQARYDSVELLTEDSFRLLDRMIDKARTTAAAAADNTHPVHSAAPSTKTFNIVLNACARSQSRNAGKRAEEIFQQMEEWLIECRQLSLPEAPPNARTLCAVMDAWAKSNGATGAAERVATILDVAIDRRIKFLRGELSPSEALIVKPDVVMFHTAILAWGTRQSKDSTYGAMKAEQLLQSMMRLNDSGELGPIDQNDEDDAGLVADTRSFNLVLSAWAEVGRHDKSGQAAENWRTDSERHDSTASHRGRTRQT